MGYHDDARLLIINADDLGMCRAINEAIFGVLQKGVVRSTTLMVPCPAALHAMHFLKENPGFAFGIHLTVISDSDNNRWRPLSPGEKVLSLINEEGYFYNFDHMARFLAEAKRNELEIEFRAQIETVLAAGLRPTHLDWHSLRISGDSDILDLMFRIAREYGLAMRIRGRPLIEKVQSQGLPTNDFDFLDSSSIDSREKPATYARLLRELPVGLSEWAAHPGVENAELRAIEPTGNGFRQADYDYFMSDEAPRIIQEEGITLISYASLHEIWQSR